MGGNHCRERERSSAKKIYNIITYEIKMEETNGRVGSGEKTLWGRGWSSTKIENIITCEIKRKGTNERMGNRVKVIAGKSGQSPAKSRKI